MKVTEDMLTAAMKSAVATGLVPKHLDSKAYLATWEGMKQTIQAALDADATLASMTAFTLSPSAGGAISQK